MGSLVSQIATVIFTLLGIILVLYLAYISTKLLGRRYSLRAGGSKRLRIIESIPAGQGKTLIVVRAGSKTFLVGTSEKNINLISELDSDEFDDEENEEQSGMDFKTAFKKVMENRFGHKDKNGKEDEDDGGKSD